jgi:hypothetical protein
MTTEDPAPTTAEEGEEGAEEPRGGSYPSPATPPTKEPFWSAGAVRTVLLSVVGVAVAGTVLGLVLTGPEPSSEAPQPPDVASPTAIDEEARDDDVVVFATDVLQTWGQSDLEYRAWWAELKPMLSPGGRQAYAFTEPSRIPDLGDVRPVEISRGGDTTATVFFATDAGRFGIDVSRRSTDDPWQAHRVVFPDQGSVFG